MHTQEQGGFLFFYLFFVCGGWRGGGGEWVAPRLPQTWPRALVCVYIYTYRDRKVLKARGSISQPDAP